MSFPLHEFEEFLRKINIQEESLSKILKIINILEHSNSEDLLNDVKKKYCGDVDRLLSEAREMLNKLIGIIENLE